MLSRGDAAPDFESIDCRGLLFKLSEFRGQRVVLFFFPRAFTPACTLEIRSFRDSQAQIEAHNAVLVGVSVDRFERQCEFARSEHIDFVLLGDESRAISEKFGVVWPVLKIDRRATFVIDEQGRIADVIHHEIQVFKHLDDVLQRLTHA